VKKPVSADTVRAHLQGIRPYGVYLLVGECTRAVVVDFDDADACPPVELINAASHYGLPAYLEISKSKGFHVWFFFSEFGVKAIKARALIKRMLQELGYPDTELFPKQDSLSEGTTFFGNFINAPLLGGLMEEGRTVFVDPVSLKPYFNQWRFLEQVQRIEEAVLDDLIAANDVPLPERTALPSKADSNNTELSRYGLPLCAQRMLRDGVGQFQRVVCFRLAVQFKRLGIPCDMVVAALKVWALKNKPRNGRGVIREDEIVAQVSYAYDKEYSGYGCESPAVKPFCEPSCPVRQWVESRKEEALSRRTANKEIPSWNLRG
jgi:hypothetical protein